MVKVSIVGTAGKDNTSNMTAQLLSAMYEKAATLITQKFCIPNESLELVSGGAAWSGSLIVIHALSSIFIPSWLWPVSFTNLITF